MAELDITLLGVSVVGAKAQIDEHSISLETRIGPKFLEISGKMIFSGPELRNYLFPTQDLLESPELNAFGRTDIHESITLVKVDANTHSSVKQEPQFLATLNFSLNFVSLLNINFMGVLGMAQSNSCGATNEGYSSFLNGLRKGKFDANDLMQLDHRCNVKHILFGHLQMKIGLTLPLLPELILNAKIVTALDYTVTGKNKKITLPIFGNYER